MHIVCFSFNTLFLLLLLSKCESLKLTEVQSTGNVILKGVREFQHRRLIELEKLQRKIEFIEQEHSTASEDLQDYLSNPIKAYKLIKRMVIDWNEIHDFIYYGNTTKDFANAWETHMNNVELPNEYDLRDAIHDLTNVDNNIDGTSSDVIYGPKLTWAECYEIGIRLYDKEDFVGAISWLKIALEKMKNSKEYNGPIRIDMAEYIAYSQYMLGDVKNAALTLERVPEISVINSTFAESKIYFLMNGKSII